jgi:hypothetical protein
MNPIDASNTGFEQQIKTKPSPYPPPGYEALLRAQENAPYPYPKPGINYEEEDHDAWVDSLPDNQGKKRDDSWRGLLKSTRGDDDSREEFDESGFSGSESESESESESDETGLAKLFPFLTSGQISRLLDVLGLSFTPEGEEDFPPYFRPLSAFIEALKWMVEEPRKNFSESEQLSPETLDEISRRIHSKVEELTQLTPELASDASEKFLVIGALPMKEDGEYVLLCYNAEKEKEGEPEKAFFTIFFDEKPYLERFEARRAELDKASDAEDPEDFDFGDLDIYAEAWVACFNQLSDAVSSYDYQFDARSFDDALDYLGKYL